MITPKESSKTTKPIQIQSSKHVVYSPTCMCIHWQVKTNHLEMTFPFQLVHSLTISFEIGQHICNKTHCVMKNLNLHKRSGQICCFESYVGNIVLYQVHLSNLTKLT